MASRVPGRCLARVFGLAGQVVHSLVDAFALGAAQPCRAGGRLERAGGLLHATGQEGAGVAGDPSLGEGEKSPPGIGVGCGSHRIARLDPIIRSDRRARRTSPTSTSRTSGRRRGAPGTDAPAAPPRTDRPQSAQWSTRPSPCGVDVLDVEVSRRLRNLRARSHASPWGRHTRQFDGRSTESIAPTEDRYLPTLAYR